MTVPSEIRVGPYTYEVKYDTNMVDIASAIGFCGCDSGEILLDPGQSHSRMRTTVLHEAMHALWDLTCRGEVADKVEEKLIANLAPALLDLLQRNEDLVFYLLQEN